MEVPVILIPCTYLLLSSKNQAGWKAKIFLISIMPFAVHKFIISTALGALRS